MTQINFSRFSGLADAIARFELEVDTVLAAGAIRRIAPPEALREEYQLAVEEVREWQGRGRSGTAPDTVMAYATTNNVSPSTAADEMISARERYETALRQIRLERLQAKAAIRASTTVREARSAYDAAAVALAAVQLGP